MGVLGGEWPLPHMPLLEHGHGEETLWTLYIQKLAFLSSIA